MHLGLWVPIQSLAPVNTNDIIGRDIKGGLESNAPTPTAGSIAQSMATASNPSTAQIGQLLIDNTEIGIIHVIFAYCCRLLFQNVGKTWKIPSSNMLIIQSFYIANL